MTADECSTHRRSRGNHLSTLPSDTPVYGPSPSPSPSNATLSGPTAPLESTVISTSSLRDRESRDKNNAAATATAAASTTRLASARQRTAHCPAAAACCPPRPRVANRQPPFGEGEGEESKKGAGMG
ncbi:Os04g0221375 [Oryza sativa Japonica Group]|uniref:Os04g0221375 protein n=1 Tax=Oryza sativa subsp. japonica TaxID=39947 RepID=A0A0P0W7Z6_ORYSJ|nr:Os04g0221375 [Oryza sativa Japonica Group]